MNSSHDLDRLLVTLDVAVKNFAVCEVARGKRLVGAPVDAIMVHYVLAGTMHMTIPGQEPIVCGPGCIAFVPPGMEPTMGSEAGVGTEVVGVEHCTISRDGLLVFDAADGGAGDLRLVAGIIIASLSGSFGLFDKLTVPIAEDMNDCDIVQQAYRMMLDEIANPGLGSRALTSALMKACLLMVVRRFLERPSSDHSLIGALAEPQLASAVACVLDNPAAPHTVASLAGHAGMSRATFARKFKSGFGLSPMEFVAKTRLHHAAELLRSSKLPIKAIAASIGFSSRSHFSRAFQRGYGSDPSAFRAANAAAALDAPRALYGDRATYALSSEPD
jgi:AraC-like DNA-binding protein